MAGRLPEKYIDQLESLIETGPKIFNLLYKIHRDGCNAITFHHKWAAEENSITTATTNTTNKTNTANTANTTSTTNTTMEKYS
ncbi:hypothetical protein DPMN_118902 [Dreissena polymorpha]|uniref:Uncharacterized protein n=1 Tax=Dreissena polymorpha TaxID=45954 RepID=A0A9D4JQQ5_DREPO|nr:hypothetical protein DPMN_118902 [Dreissena polymorpha]